MTSDQQSNNPSISNAKGPVLSTSRNSISSSDATMKTISRPHYTATVTKTVTAATMDRSHAGDDDHDHTPNNNDNNNATPMRSNVTKTRIHNNDAACPTTGLLLLKNDNEEEEEEGNPMLVSSIDDIGCNTINTDEEEEEGSAIQNLCAYKENDKDHDVINNKEDPELQDHPQEQEQQEECSATNAPIPNQEKGHYHHYKSSMLTVQGNPSLTFNIKSTKGIVLLAIVIVGCIIFLYSFTSMTLTKSREDEIGIDVVNRHEEEEAEGKGKYANCTGCNGFHVQYPNCSKLWLDNIFDQIGDGHCDLYLDNVECGYDGGDCL